MSVTVSHAVYRCYDAEELIEQRKRVAARWPDSSAGLATPA